MGGKGGVGKTSAMAALAEWFEVNEIPAKLLDLDTENKARGSLTHFFGGAVPKVNIHTPAGPDSFVDQLADGPPVILADMGAGAGQVIRASPKSASRGPAGSASTRDLRLPTCGASPPARRKQESRNRPNKSM